jgi:hypothetical protein
MSQFRWFFSYRVVSKTGKFLFRENSLQSLSSNFEQILGNFLTKLREGVFLLLISAVFSGTDLKFSLEISRQKSFGLIGVVFLGAGGHFVSCLCR